MKTWAQTRDDLRQAALDFDGVEVPEPLWPHAEDIVASDPAFSLGHARGPDSYFRRLYPPEAD